MSKDRKILVVDPTESFRELLFKTLTLDGHRVEACEGGIPALQKIYEGYIDLVLVDAEIGDIEIFKFLRASQKESPWIPIVVVSANTSNEFEKQIRKNRIFYFATKPFSLEILKSVIRDALRPRRDKRVWMAEEWKHLKAVTRSLLNDALNVLSEIKRECEDRADPESILEGHGPRTEELPHCGWPEMREKLHLLEHHLDFALRLTGGRG